MSKNSADKGCIVCGGGHHYYNCPNDDIQEDGSINITHNDLTLLVDLTVEKIKINKDDKYKLLHKKLLDIMLT